MEFELMQDVKLSIMVLGVFLGFSLSIFLVLNKSAKNRANMYLGILVFTVTLYFIPFFLARFQLLAHFPHFVGLPRVIPFLFGPLTYLYVRACTQKGFEMKPILWLHFVPAFLMLLHCLPQFLASGAEKVINHGNFSRTGDLDYAWIWLLKVMHATTYFAISTNLILKYRKHVSNSASVIDRAFHRWLLVFIAILSFPILGLLGFVFIEFNQFSLLFLALGILAFLIAIYIATLVKPRLFHDFPHQMLIPESKEEKKQKYENSNLQMEQKERYLEKVLYYMKTERPYKEPELTLSQLAEQVNIPYYHISQVINEELNCNFLDFINGYRVKAAQENLLDPKLDHYTIVAIAYESGFKAKSTFYTAFKKKLGMTPSQYRKSKVDISDDVN